MMRCEEFERFGLDMDRADTSPEEAAQAAEHAAHCPHCSGLLASWRAVKADLKLLRETTLLESAPARVEMRLKQELRTRRESRVPRRAFSVSSWTLAAAAILAITVGWLHTGQKEPANKASAGTMASVAQPASSSSNEIMLLASDYDASSFTQLPFSMPSASTDESVLQVRLQRGALMQFGLPVEPEQASDWVDVDLLVGEDGQPVAVRLHQDTTSHAGSHQQ